MISAEDSEVTNGDQNKRIIEEVYKKVIKRCITQRHEGKVALCCNIFFSCASKNKSSLHCEVIGTKEFRVNNKVHTLEDLEKYFEGEVIKLPLQYNVEKCGGELTSQEIDNLLSKEEIAELKGQLQEKQEFISKILVV